MREGEDDTRLLRRVAAQSRIRSVELLNSGNIFVTARAHHPPTHRDVLLTIARPDDADAGNQVAVVRKMLDAIHDERIGVVIDLFWEDAGTGWRCLVSPLYQDLQPLNSALLSRSQGAARVKVLAALRAACKQLQSIHAMGYAHGDVSMQNIGVDSSGAVHLLDFEHVVGTENLTRQRVASTPGYSHPNKLSAVAQGGHDVRLHQTWDMYAMGRVFLDVLSYLAPHGTPELTPRNQRALRLLGCLMLDGKNSEVEHALGLGSGFFEDEKFESIGEVVSALDRFLGRTRIEDVVPEIAPVMTGVVELGSADPVPFTRRVQRLLNTSEMRALDGFNQLGLICYIWPTATHRRKEHAIGTFGTTVTAVRRLLTDPESPTFQVLMTPERVRVLILAALLHDVGHYALAHDLEEAHSGAFAHENRSVLLIQGAAIASILGSPEEEGGWNVPPKDVAAVIEGKPLAGSTLGRDVCNLLHSVISGPIDTDKLDYLVRDSSHLNVRAGDGIDVARLVAALTVATSQEPTGPTLRLAVRAKSRRPAELVGRIRSHMFGVAYWHHSYRAIKAMIQWIVWCAVEVGTQPGSKLVGRRLASEFFEYIDTTITTGSVERSALFGIGGVQGVDKGAIPEGEARVLAWLTERGGTQAEVLFKMLANHNWYRSIITIEHPSSEVLSADDSSVDDARTIWDGLARVYKMKDDERIVARMALARSFQETVLRWLSEQSEGEANTIVYDFSDIKSQMLADGLTSILFLVDGPDQDKAFQKPLYYTIRDERGYRSVNAALAIPVVKSYDSARLSDEFVAANGAVRVFCDPRYVDFFASAVLPDTLRIILRDAIASVLAKD